MRSALVGQVLTEVEVADDTIVLSGVPHELVRAAVTGATVTGVGRKGKFWWLELDRKPWLFGHLGMAGWIRELGEPTARLREHGKAPLDDEDGRPRFLKLLLTGANGRRIAMTDGRRLARLWLGDSPESDERVARLGPDAHADMPSSEALLKKWKGRTAPIKGMLLDQAQMSGVGNYLADEALYQSGISPKREAGSLTGSDIDRLRSVLHRVLNEAIQVGADSEKFPAEWLFHHRWGGSKGADLIEGEQIVREAVAGRTTAWVPSRQK